MSTHLQYCELRNIRFNKQSISKQNNKDKYPIHVLNLTVALSAVNFILCPECKSAILKHIYCPKLRLFSNFF
jgi:ribosomal protein L32